TINYMQMRTSLHPGKLNLFGANMGFTILIFGFILFLSSCIKPDLNPLQSGLGKIVYVESNDFHTNQNSILAYINKGDGTLEPLVGSPFWTKGAGLGNPDQILGPDDQETPIIVTPDSKFLLAVNGGSNTIA